LNRIAVKDIKAPFPIMAKGQLAAHCHNSVCRRKAAPICEQQIYPVVAESKALAMARDQPE
jgi:hypothetical protein